MSAELEKPMEIKVSKREVMVKIIKIETVFYKNDKFNFTLNNVDTLFNGFSN